MVVVSTNSDVSIIRKDGYVETGSKVGSSIGRVRVRVTGHLGPEDIGRNGKMWWKFQETGVVFRVHRVMWRT